MEPVYYLLIWILTAAAAVYIVGLIRKHPEKPNPNGKLPYKKQKEFLSPAEHSFYCAMQHYLEGRLTICPKVGIKELVCVEKGVGREWRKYFNWISRKHVDFVLCRPDNMEVVCAVELDDKSHLRQDRRRRDEFVDKLFEKTEIPLFHIPVKQGYSRGDFEGILLLVENVSS